MSLFALRKVTKRTIPYTVVLVTHVEDEEEESQAVAEAGGPLLERTRE